MFDQFNHRYADYSERGSDRGHRVLPELGLEKLINNNISAEPYYWVPDNELRARIAPCAALIGYGEATTASTLRTCVMCAFPYAGVGHKEILIRSKHGLSSECLLLANGNAIVLDYICRTKVSYLNRGQYIFKQLPFIPPTRYDEAARAFVLARVLELSYTSQSLAQFARELGYSGQPFLWNEDRRALLRAELDAFYARAYGLSRDELRYILDPADVMGPDYPSETFRVLKDNEMKRYGEYRTRRMVLEAWDRQVGSRSAA